MNTWQVPRMWEGGEVWILGGGPSLLTCFNIPKDVVQDVRNRRKGLEVYSPYLAAIHKKHVIGINVAYKFGNWVDICFFGDKGFYLTHVGGLSRFRKIVVTDCEKVGRKNVSWVKYLPQEIKRDVPSKYSKFGISTRPDRVSWNGNSGAGAISVAAWSGVKRIVLVGFDMTLDSVSKEQHFHNEYREVNKKRMQKELPFSVHLQPWGIIKKDADNMGIEILNTSLNSAIKEIPKVHIKELL